jgi:hypothetical protein
VTPRLPAPPRRRVAAAIGAVLALVVGLLGGVTLDVAATSASAQAAVDTTPTVLSVGAPSWWQGDCDATRWGPLAAAQGWKGGPSHRLGASWLGVPVCGPRPWVDGSPNVLWGRAGWGESEWQCVEVAQRFMAQIYGTVAYGANGSGVVSNYSTSYGGGLVKVTNGTVGKAPGPGDVVSFRTPANIYGHVGVIASSSIDANGDGSVRMLSQNDTVDGWRTLAVVGWTLQGFGSLTPYGWLHDPAGRGNPLGDGAFVRVLGKAGTWRIVGGAPLAIGSWTPLGGPQPYVVVEQAQFDRLRATPRDGTYLRDAGTGSTYRIAGGAPLSVGTADAAALPGWGTAPTVEVDGYAIRKLDHLSAVPADGTQLCRADDGSCYLVGGGAPLLVPASAKATLPGWSAARVTVVSGLEFSAFRHLNAVPADGTFLCDASTSQCYRVAGGAPLLLSKTDNPPVPGWSTASRLTVPHAEFAGFQHLRRYPVDGTIVCPVGDASCYVFAGRAPLPITPAAARSVSTLSTSRAIKVSSYELRHPVHIATRPVDGTVLVGAQTKATYVVRSGVAQYFAAAGAADLTAAPVIIDQSAVDNAGLSGAWSHLASNPASVRLSSPTTTFTTAGSAVVTWNVPVASSAVSSYAVRYRKAGVDGAFSPWVAPGTWAAISSTRVSLPLAQGATYCFQTRATNRARQTGPWSPSHCTSAPVDDRAASATSSGWLRGASPVLYSGTGLRTTTKGAWWRKDGVTLSQVGIVATTCASCGSVTVFVAGRSVGTISLVSPTTVYQSVLTLPAFTRRTGAVTLVVTSPSSHSVQIDGVAFSGV